MGSTRVFGVSLVLCVILALTIPPALTCPDGCWCDGQHASCQDLKDTVTFPDSVTKVNITKSSDLVFDHNTFGKYVTDIRVSETHIANISSGAFESITTLKTLDFSDVRIKTVNSCAFSKIRASAQITISNAHIDDIEPGAFSDVQGIKQLKFEHSVIHNLKSFAFSALQAEAIAFHDTMIKTIHSSSFFEISQVLKFEMINFNSQFLSKNAFRDAKNIQSVTIQKCSFGAIECGAILELYFGTPFPHRTFSFTDSVVKCNCDTIPLINMLRINPRAASDSVQCSSQSVAERHVLLSKASTTKMCPDNTNEHSCEIESLERPSCPVTSGRQSSTPSSVVEGTSGVTSRDPLIQGSTTTNYRNTSGHFTPIYWTLLCASILSFAVCPLRRIAI